MFLGILKMCLCSLQFFKIYFLGYICGGLNNYKGYHIVLLLLNVKQGCGKDMPPKRHNSNFSFSFCVFLPGPFVWYGYQPFLQWGISFFFSCTFSHSLWGSYLPPHGKSTWWVSYNKRVPPEGMLLRGPCKVKKDELKKKMN